MKIRTFAVLALSVALSACQTAPATPLAPQDFTINASKLKTKEAIIATFLPRNYKIIRDSEFQLVLDRPANDNFGAMLLFGSKFNGVPDARVTFTITGDNPTQVNSRLELVTNPGSGFEQVTDINGNSDARAALQRGMTMVKEKAETK
ncbi:hypothetical protein [Rhizobium rhizogenes]|uniref:Lipoprotein n=1 Tax=Rhizobium rhizogenes NBRC 13257 TaxID=1220581 RepID=A0AA87Q7D0_RHIRH|nr:hypothetical protein [Rhizobium rhizogenes]KEA04835.1 hypothetical protein CN09_13365 [Rhizobium rhizogenes]NTG65395.1 hypothetical protein [Rhizobium rhizogenes]NTI66258.1 hypothetical protein [Rhizobium rhizogenes]NTI79167.1 hypothetical protein [Rhizobium rhizogenes]NTJ21268.1 hypothetical protein [Rhizobium rhizogenes]